MTFSMLKVVQKIISKTQNSTLNFTPLKAELEKTITVSILYPTNRTVGSALQHLKLLVG